METGSLLFLCSCCTFSLFVCPLPHLLAFLLLGAFPHAHLMVNIRVLDYQFVVVVVVVVVF